MSPLIPPSLPDNRKSHRFPPPSVARAVTNPSWPPAKDRVYTSLTSAPHSLRCPRATDHAWTLRSPPAVNTVDASGDTATARTAAGALATHAGYILEECASPMCVGSGVMSVFVHTHTHASSPPEMMESVPNAGKGAMDVTVSECLSILVTTPHTSRLNFSHDDSSWESVVVPDLFFKSWGVLRRSCEGGSGVGGLTGIESQTAFGISHRYTQCSPCTGEDRYSTPSVLSFSDTWHIAPHLAFLPHHLLPRIWGFKRKALAKSGCGPSTGVSRRLHSPFRKTNRVHEPLSYATKSLPASSRPEPTRLMIRTDPAASFHPSGACTRRVSVQPDLGSRLEDEERISSEDESVGLWNERTDPSA